jgi:hypothetical protein
VKWIARRGNVSASTNFSGESEPNGVMINYYQKAPVQGDVTVKIMQGSRVVAETKGPNAAGMNQVLWNMRATPVTIPGQPAPQASGRGGFGGGGFGGQQAPPAYPTFGGAVPAEVGEYTVIVAVGGKSLTQKFQVIEDAWFDRMF